MKKYALCLTAMLALLLTFGSMLVGCDNGNGSGSNPDSNFVPVTGITNTLQIALKDDEFELGGVVTPSNATNQTITWSGADVTNGKFKATTAGNHTVTATIAKGVSESTPFTRNFIIKVIDASNTASAILEAQGSWSRESTFLDGTDTFTIIGYKFVFTNDSIGDLVYSKGIILTGDGTRYEIQGTHNLGYDGQLHPDYYYSIGTYSITGGTTFTIIPDDHDPAAEGTWTKVGP
jgi:hypothetical protein